MILLRFIRFKLQKFELTDILQQIIFIFATLIMVYLLFSCEASTDPEIGNDNLQQMDIPWPSLANTPWPMNHHDPQSTGRSNYVGPNEGAKENKIPFYGIEGSLVLDNSNNIYITTSYFPTKLSVFSIGGDNLWDYKTSTTTGSTPILCSNTVVPTNLQ